MTEAKREPKRQARGERRITQILAAAADVFADAGYEAATTNAIAARAGISPGSLYQFFANKDAIAGALAEHYAVELGAAHITAFSAEDLDGLSVGEMVDRVIPPLVRFNLANRGFKTLFARTDMPPSLAHATAPIHEAMERRVGALLAARGPGLGADDLARTVTVAVQIVRAMMPLVVRAEGGERDRMDRELRRALTLYLADALRADPPQG